MPHQKEDTWHFGRAGSLKEDSHAYGITSSASVQILKPSAVRTSRFFTSNSDSRSVET
jgi:hypothetical protein